MLIETPPADPRYLDGAYLSANPDWHSDDAAWKVEHALAVLRQSGIQPATLCEVGAGSGAAAALLANALPETRLTAFEISPQAFALCAAREAPNLRFVQGTPFASSETYDLAVAFDVIEHVEDPFSFVRAIGRISRRQLLHIPLDMNALAIAREWPIAQARAEIGHLHYFSRGSALALLRECGLSIVAERYTPWAIDQRHKSWRKRLAATPRALAYRLSPHATVRLLGGWSLMVLTERMAGGA